MLNLLLTVALASTPQAKPATNTICPVLGHAVTAKSPIVELKGREYRLCCPGCDKKLLADPDKYLEKDGTPKNATKDAPKMPAGHEGHQH